MNIKNTKGFTLIELMIVVAILGIITAIALPSYTEYVQRGKRTDAKVELLRIAQLQEGYFVQNLSYATALTIGAGGLGLGDTVESEQNEYAITMAAQDSGNGACTGLAADSCTAYTLTATPVGGQRSDTACLSFTLTNTGAKGISPTATDTVRNCWK